MCTNGNRWRAVTARAVVAAGVVLGACDSPTEGEGTFTVGGTVSGLAGAGCELRNNGGDALSIAANGRFTFASSLANAAPYDVTVFQQPIGPDQTCVVIRGDGAVPGGDVLNVAVNCTTITPTCASFVDMGAVSGDEGLSINFESGTGDGWYRARLIENSSSSIYISADVELIVPPGIDYDLTVHCVGCGGAIAGESTLSTGSAEVVAVRWADRPGTDDSAYILIHVKYFSGQSPTPWSLRVRGHTGVAAVTCSL